MTIEQAYVFFATCERSPAWDRWGLVNNCDYFPAMMIILVHQFIGPAGLARCESGEDLMAAVRDAAACGKPTNWSPQRGFAMATELRERAIREAWLAGIEHRG